MNNIPKQDHYVIPKKYTVNKKFNWVYDKINPKYDLTHRIYKYYHIVHIRTFYKNSTEGERLIINYEHDI